MASRREQILVAAAAALSAGGGPAGLNVHRQRALPIDQDKLPSTVVYAVRDTTEGKGGSWTPLVQRELQFMVECRTTGEPADQQLDPLLTWTTQQLMLDPTFGGLAQELNEGDTEWDAVSSNKVLAAAAVTFRVKYQTQRDDPENA